ncbi:hypothetical protein [Gordonia shandongensis]|uniref:hypothetical protein n=1 Tax=Gordonia shandongensis TaxID=376351 RepID=UPI00055026D9|nr:hypothetical protein [Gordonia shandongensis]
MTYRSELERLTTLTAEEVADACAGRRLSVLTTRCIDEVMELDALADEALADDDSEGHAYYHQEASAWRETAQLLRALTHASARGGAHGAA